jgi:hypothetical protein
MEPDQDQPVADEPKTVGGVFAASLPAALSAGMFAIGALLISLQVQFARVEATLQQMAGIIGELKNDSKAELTQLDQRLRALEMRN